MGINGAGSSFRDPSGFIFFKDHRVYRQINICYKDNYEMLMRTGLYARLTAAGFLVSHKEVGTNVPSDAFKIIAPDEIPFVSYPYEWCFEQLKDAALLTLAVQKEAFARGMSLKDASAFNVQFVGAKPIFIDTLSFEKYREGSPWVAYKQFCEHFLAPLALAAFCDVRLGQLSRVYLDGIPLDLATKLLPLSAKIKPLILFHIVLHARAQKNLSSPTAPKPASGQKFGRAAFAELIDSLQATIQGLECRPAKSVWSDYQGNSCESYENAAFARKKTLVAEFLQIAKPKTLWDLGANSGTFSTIAAKMGIYVISMDNDESVVEKNYHNAKEENKNNILPLLVDITNPTPGTGWANTERDPLLSRPRPDTLLALALVHHLAIAKNIPLPMIAKLFAAICKTLIIEFVPKEDKQTQRLLLTREDIFNNYNETTFEDAFGKFFAIVKKTKISESERTLYLMAVKNNS